MKRAHVVANERLDHQQSWGGAFAEGLDKEWVRVYHAEHGSAYGAR